jgi:hypothetical protein
MPALEGIMRKLFFVLLLATATSAYAIEPYHAQQIEVYRGGNVQPYQAETIKPYQSETVKPYQAETIKPYQAETIKPYQSEIIKPYQAETVKPYEGQAIQQQAPAASPTRGQDRLPESRRSGKGSKKANAAQGARALVGIWQTNIPGAVYTTPSGLSGYDILHVSSGAAAGLLKINANGTYSWNSYGGKKGKWIMTSDPEYPIAIIDTVENRRWRVGYSAAKATLFIWDGSIWYEGRRAAVK